MDAGTPSITAHHVHAVAETLYNLRGLTDSELLVLLGDAARGDPEAIEWAVARMGDLTAARDTIEAILLAALAAKYVSIYDAAEELTTTPSALYRLIGRRRIRTVEGPRQGRGPSTVQYISRADLPALGRS